MVAGAAALCDPAIENPVIQIIEGNTATCTAGRLVVDGEISSAYNMTIAAQVTVNGATQLGTGAGTAGHVWTSTDTTGKGEWAAASGGGTPTDVLETVGDLEIENQNTTGNILVKMGFTWASPLASTGEFRVEDTASDAAIAVNSARAVRLAHYVEMGDPAATGTGTHVYHSGPSETGSGSIILTTDQVLKGFFWSKGSSGSATDMEYPAPSVMIAALADVGITATENMYLPRSYTRWGGGGGGSLALSCNGCSGATGYSSFYGPGTAGTSTSTLTIPLGSVCQVQYIFKALPGANIFVICQE